MGLWKFYNLWIWLYHYNLFPRGAGEKVEAHPWPITLAGKKKNLLLNESVLVGISLGFTQKSDFRNLAHGQCTPCLAVRNRVCAVSYFCP